MKKIISFLFYVSVGLIPFGLIFRFNDWAGEALFITLGLLGLLIYFLSRTIKDIVKNKNSRLNITLQILISFTSIILFSKYFYHFFGDYPGIIIVPLFMVVAFIYLFKSKIKDNRLTISTIAFLILCIPLFGLEFYKSPRQLIPQNWSKEYNIDTDIGIVLPYNFQFKKTEELSNAAFDLRNNKQFVEAIKVYRRALKLEPKNPRLFFDISYCYKQVNDLETAISVLDSAILIDSTNAGFFNNRGLLYYKLNENVKAINDYNRAIKIDSTNSVFYSNLALVYYYEKINDKSCESIAKAEKLGINAIDFGKLQQIKNRICK